MGRVRAGYTSKFKLQVVHYAQEHGNRAAGRKFDGDEKNVCDFEYFEYKPHPSFPLEFLAKNVRPIHA
jgi:hypothetical protein